MEFYSIGDFYQEIQRGLDHLYGIHGDALFCGDPKRQVTSEYYYSGGGELHPVVCISSARAAMELITGQGEGDGGGIYDKERELAHFYRFEQLKLGRYYQPGDRPHEPTGPECRVDWDAVYPAYTNPRLEHFRASEELYETARTFNRSYAEFLALVTQAFDGRPELLLEGVPRMFALRDAVNQLVRNPVPGSKAAADSSAVGQVDGPAHAAPTFELAEFSR